MTRDAVGHLLESRPSKEQLIESNILPRAAAERARGLQGVGGDLERNMMRDRLAHAVARRPSLADMRDMNWMRGEQGVAEEGGEEDGGGFYGEEGNDDEEEEDEEEQWRAAAAAASAGGVHKRKWE